MKSRFLTNMAIFTVLSSSMFAAALKLTPEEKDLSVRNVKAKHGVVASAHPLASKMGIEILKKGGNAIDAAVGVAFTLGLVEPNASGPGGGGYMLINRDHKQKLYSYYQKAPKAMTLEKWEEIFPTKKYKTDGIGFLVPGAVAGWLTALEQQGTMQIDEILEPIIELAEEGFEITPTLAGIMADTYDKLLQNESISETFLNEGLPYSQGEIFKNPDYANTLRLIAKNGKDGFYKGQIAKSILAENPLMTQDDLDSYRPLVLEPIATKYRDYTIVSTNPESSGLSILELLNMVENYDLKKMGEENPKLYHIWAEAMNLSQIDRYEYVADPNFADVPTEELISQKYADIRVKEIDEKKAGGKVKAGYISNNLNKTILDREHSSTTHVSIIDKHGNAVSMTNTVGNFFGYGIVPEGAGFVMNSHFDLFSEMDSYPRNGAEPEKRPKTGMAPAMVLDKKGNVKLVIGTPGGARIPSVTPYVISNVLDHGMSIQEAINYPRIHKIQGKLYVEEKLDGEVLEYLEGIGHQMIKKGPISNYFGGVHAIEVTKNGFEGGADPRRDGKALGY